MSSYLKGRFYEHQFITAVISRHLADNFVKHDDKVGPQVTALEKAVEKTARGTEKLETLIKDLDKQVSALDKSVKALQTKVDRLEHRQNSTSRQESKNGGRGGEGSSGLVDTPSSQEIPDVPHTHPSPRSFTVPLPLPPPAISPPPTSPPAIATIDHPSTQVMVCGLRDVGLPGTSCVIIAQAWPSWLVVSQSLHLDCVQVFVEDPSLAALQGLQCHFPGVRWETWNNPTWQERVERGTVILGQSDSDKAQAWLPLFADTHKVLWVTPADHNFWNPASWDRLTIDHSSVGGALAGSWTSSSNRPFVRGGSLCNVQRRIRHFVNEATRPTSRMLSVTPPSDTELESSDKVEWLNENTVDCRGLFPAGSSTLKVRCKSAFTATKWTIRPLSLLELGGVYDIPQSILKPVTEEPSSTPDFTKVEAPPTKLLTWIYRQWAVQPPSSVGSPSESLCQAVGGEPPIPSLHSPPEGAQNVKGGQS